MSAQPESVENVVQSRDPQASTYAEERWQGPSFAASWISPPSPRRVGDDPTLPMRGDDHA